MSETADHKTSILIVDDDQFMRVTLQAPLEVAGFRTTAVGDGKSAIEKLEESSYDLVLLDLVMPDMDGFQTCRRIREMPECRHTPVLMITGLADSTSINRAFEAGAIDFLTKPVTADLLIHKIRYVLRASRSMKSLADREAQLAEAQRIASLGSWEIDPSTCMLTGSDETFRILGIEEPCLRVPLERFFRTVDPEERERVRSQIRLGRDGVTSNLECRIRRSGVVRIVRLQAHVDITPGNRPRLSGTIQDITEMRQAEDRVRMLKEAVDCLPIGVGITLSDIDGKILHVNRAEAEMHGYLPHELIEMEVGQLAPGNLRERISPETFANTDLWRRESVNIRKNGEEFPVVLSSVPVRDEEGRCLGVVTACEDITSRREAEKTIHQLAYYDPLTRLPNRETLLDRLQQALALADRENRRVGLLFLDLDNFKDINDTQGHILGDKLLREVSSRLASVMRGSDTLARLGGDEFVLLLTSISGQECAAIVSQRILSILSGPFDIDGRQLHSSASIGVALYPDDGPDVESLLKCADTAMYHAKDEGRSTYRFFSPEMNRKIMRRVEIENALRHGIERNEFFLLYQPQWDLNTRKIVGVEALLRWRNPDLGLLPPSEFIPLAEMTGLMLPLGEWTLRSACLQARQWALAGHRDLKVTVNISGKQFKQPDFLETTKRVFEETGTEPQLIGLEFTESVLMEKAEKSVETLGVLKEMGVDLSIDDFGTGYSSLNYLKHFPIDRIKIDRSFISDINRSSDDAAIVEAVISMAHTLRLKVVAEGVENRDQMSFLAARNCDEAQGFHLAMPMSAEEAAGFLGGASWGKMQFQHLPA